MTTLPTGISGNRAYALGIYRLDLANEGAWGHTGFWNTLSFHVPARDVTIAISVTQKTRGPVSRSLLALALQAVTGR